jgi:hypothetical protein
MRVRCVKSQLSAEQRSSFGPAYSKAQTFEATVGTDYDVLGVVVTLNAPARGTGAYVVVSSDPERPSLVPLVLFEVLDPRVSPQWRLTATHDEIDLLPAELARDHFFDLLSERDPTALADLRSAIAKSHLDS